MLSFEELHNLEPELDWYGKVLVGNELYYARQRNTHSIITKFAAPGSSLSCISLSAPMPESPSGVQILYLTISLKLSVTGVERDVSQFTT